MDSLLKCHIGECHALLRDTTPLRGGPTVGTVFYSNDVTITSPVIPKSLAPIFASSINDSVFEVNTCVCIAIHDLYVVVSEERV